MKGVGSPRGHLVKTDCGYFPGMAWDHIKICTATILIAI